MINGTILSALTLPVVLVSHRPLFYGVSMDSLKYRQGPPLFTTLLPAGWATCGRLTTPLDTPCRTPLVPQSLQTRLGEGWISWWKPSLCWWVWLRRQTTSGGTEKSSVRDCLSLGNQNQGNRKNHKNDTKYKK
jgi:hypothetical protein